MSILYTIYSIQYLSSSLRRIINTTNLSQYAWNECLIFSEPDPTFSLYAFPSSNRTRPRDRP